MFDNSCATYWSPGPGFDACIAELYGNQDMCLMESFSFVSIYKGDTLRLSSSCISIQAAIAVTGSHKSCGRDDTKVQLHTLHTLRNGQTLSSTRMTNVS